MQCNNLYKLSSRKKAARSNFKIRIMTSLAIIICCINFDEYRTAIKLCVTIGIKPCSNNV